VSSNNSPLARFTSRHSVSETEVRHERLVIKRDGSAFPWDVSKITRAVALAFYDAKHAGAPNPYRNHAAERYGIDLDTLLKAWPSPAAPLARWS
jgi:hypothetical protein